MAFISADLFPTKLSFIIFISYMGLFINQGILVTASKSKDNSYKYNTVTVVLVTELLKLIAAVVLYVKDHSVGQMFEDFVKHRKVMALYFIPAALYCLYNNLQFVNLAAYDPTTYYLLLQFRVVVTGVVFQILFQKKLSKVQWASLFILTVGCVIKELSHSYSKSSEATSGDAPSFNFFDIHFLFIMLQVFSSCFAGVYNEFLLKDKGGEVHIMMANIYMYLNSIVCNALILAFQGELVHAFTPDSIRSIIQPGVLVIAFNNAAIGIVTSLFLRNLNSILKTFASALELMFTAILCWILFGIPVDIFTFIAIFIVSAATYLYAQNPVVNKARVDIEAEQKEKTPQQTSSLPVYVDERSKDPVSPLPYKADLREDSS